MFNGTLLGRPKQTDEGDIFNLQSIIEHHLCITILIEVIENSEEGVKKKRTFEIVVTAEGTILHQPQKPRELSILFGYMVTRKS